MDFIKTFFQEMGAMLSIPWSFVILEVIGTLAGAVSGARLASSKKFDLFGALIVGIATACGGGTIRDLMIGKPPFWLEEPIYLLACIFGLLWVFVFRKVLVRQNNTWFLFDCIGFSLFNVIGIEKSLGLGFPTWAAICLGCITGAGGGVMRDILINEVPLIFRKEIYATCWRYRLCSLPAYGLDTRGLCAAILHRRHHHPNVSGKVPLESSLH